jgi:hypothetical protein
MEVGMPIIDTLTPGKEERFSNNLDDNEETKDGEFDPLLKILAQTLIANVLNMQISAEQMSQELTKRGMPLQTEQIRDFLST